MQFNYSHYPLVIKNNTVVCCPDAAVLLEISTSWFPDPRDRLRRLVVAVTSPWRRVSTLSVTESGRLFAAAAGSKLTDSLGASNRHFGVREP